MKCDYCEIAQKKVKSAIVYEDEEIIAVIKDLAASPGQVCLMPKKHYTILEMVPDFLVSRLFKIAKKISVAVFEGLGAQGTNLIVQNGTGAGQEIPHFGIEIIPRREGDGLNFQWKTLSLMDEEKETAYLMLKEEGEKIAIAPEEEKREEVFSEGKLEMVVEKEDDENYLVKQLRRLP